MASTVITGTGTITSSNAAGTTLSAATAPVTNTYTAGQVITFSNAGAVIDTGAVAGNAGILLTIGSVAGATDIIRNSGSIQAYSYGIETTPNGATTNAVSVSNSGVINIVGGVGTAHDASGIFATGGVQETVDNTGTIIAPTGVFLLPNGASGTFAVSNEGVITATQQFTGGSYKYGIRIQGNPSGALAGTAIITNTGTINGFVDAAVLNATITNKGTITAGVFALGTGTFIDAAGAVNGAKVQFVNQNSLQGASGLLSTLDLVAGTVAIGTLSNPSVYTGFGYVTVATGADFQIGNAASAVSIPNVTSIADFGTLQIAGSIAGTTINMEGTVAGAASTVDFTGTNTSTPISNYANNDEIVIGTLALPAPAAGSSFQDIYNTATGVLTTNEINASGATIGTTNITLTGVPGTTYSSGSFDVLQGPNGQTIALATSQIANNGSIYLDFGEHATLANSSLDNENVTFGTHGSLTGPNVLALNGANQPLNGYFTSNAGTISGFGLNDIITLGTNNIGALPTDVLTYTYDPSSGRYQIVDQTEFQRTQNISLSTDSFIFSPASSYSGSSFVETYGTNGINIETQATDAEQGYTFNANGTADINTIQDYSGKVAPGASIVTGEVVTIASGTATFASANTVPLANGQAGTFASTFVNSGTILVSGTTSAFTDYSTLTGGGTIVAANGGHINVLDNSGGTDAAQTLQFGTGGTSLALNTIDLNATSGSFAGTIAGFGTNDDIVIGPSLIPGDNSWIASFNNYVTLAYAGSLLTVGEVEYPAGGVGTPTTLYTTLDVGTGYSVGSFVALYGTNGINIETTPTVLEKPFTLVATPGTSFVEFADPNQYVGGLAPGDSIISGESIIVNGGSATVEIQNPVANSGNIIINSGELLNNGNTLGASDLTGTGTITIQNGAEFAQLISGGTNTIAFGGNTTSNFNVIGIGGSATSFTSPIAGFGSNDEVLLKSSILPTPGSASSFTETYNTATGALVISEFNAGGSLVGATTLTVLNTGSLNSSSFVAVAGAGGSGVDVLLGSSTLLSTTGSIYIDNGESVTLTDTSGVDTIPVTFGTHGSVGAFNTLDINGSVSGTSSPYQGTISGFGLNDDIIIGPSTLPSLATGSAVTLSYSGSLLTVGEVNSAGSVTASTTIDVGTGYSASSFVALLGTNGINIETPATVDEQGFTLQAGVPGNFENPTLYVGGLAPGNSIVSGETVTIVPTSLADLTTPVNNSGVILLAGTGPNANFDVLAPLTGTGTILVTGGGELVIQNPTGTTTNTIAFGPSISGTTDIAYFDTPGTAGFGGVIANVGPGDDIDLGSSFLPTPTAASAISLSFAGGVLSIFDTVGGTVYTDMLTISGTVPGTFSASLGTMPDRSTGIVIADVPCFAAGTRILTSGGQVAVESIKVGDKVLTVRDGAEAEVVWVGQRTIDLARHAMPEKVRPVRILAGAFGEGLPERDLRLSPDHALFIDGHLIEAKTLVNGVTVIEEMATRFVTYHHVELANHDIMLAEGLAAESYLDSGNRMMFESDAAPMMLHPDFAAISREKACAPLLTDGDVVVAARARLLERAVALGFAMTGAVDLTALVAGLAVAPEHAGDELLFVLPGKADSVELVSSTGVPAETSAQPGDRRSLGVAITGLALIAGGKRMVIALDDPAHTGFYEMEHGHRWTNGAARVALPAYTGRAVLEVTINGQAARWVAAA